MKIKSIFGQHPLGNGADYIATVGFGGVTQIHEYLGNIGSYETLWFLVFIGDHLHKKVNAAHVSQVIYFDKDEAGAA